jgi:hypothetical protein
VQQLCQRRIRQLYSGRLEQGAGFARCEAKIGRAELRQLAVNPQAVQSELRFAPAREHELDLGGGVFDEALELLNRLV